MKYHRAIGGRTKLDVWVSHHKVIHGAIATLRDVFVAVENFLTVRLINGLFAGRIRASDRELVLVHSILGIMLHAI